MNIIVDPVGLKTYLFDKGEWLGIYFDSVDGYVEVILNKKIPKLFSMEKYLYNEVTETGTLKVILYDNYEA